ncbi:MAG TPA: hypothetical protein VE503_11740 [Ornithinibacter sp.]|nr:hypothetical protein [Ornithinibacter sp.]
MRRPATSVRDRAAAPPVGQPVWRRPAVGAGVAQLAQAAGSFGLQLVAAHALGASGLGVVSLCLGVMILTTAVTSGVVGDSLTVLDRHDRRIRAGLQVWGVVLSVVGATVSAVALAAGGVLSVAEATALFLATLAFQWEEVLRRVFMARMRFWTLLLVDGTAVTTTIGVLGAAAALGALDLRLFFLAVAGGQAAGVACALLLLPREERRVAGLRGAAMREVLSFGGWRGAQVAVTPLGLTVTRLLVLSVGGSAALGEVEAARIFGAPSLLLVQGLGSYLLAAFARDRAMPLGDLRRAAARAATRLSVTALVLGVLLATSAALVGHVVVGPRVDVHPWTVLGWAVFAAAVGTMQPFAAAAVTRGRQREVLALRCLDALIGVGLLAVLLVVFAAPPSVTPYVLAAGPLAGGLLIRRLLLVGDHPTPGKARP